MTFSKLRLVEWLFNFAIASILLLAPRMGWRQDLRNVNYYPGTEEAHTNPTRQRGECLRALAGALG